MVGRQELQAFHSTAYLAFLHSHNEQGEEKEKEEEEEEEEEEGYGLGRVVTAVISKYYSTDSCTSSLSQHRV